MKYYPEQTEELESFVFFTVGSDFGDLELAVGFEQIESVQPEYLAVGSTIVCDAVLQGDVAIYQYEKGIVKDLENDLHCLAQSFQCGDFERLQRIISPELQFFSEQTGIRLETAEAFLERQKQVYEKMQKDFEKLRCFARCATIIEVPEEGENLYPLGSRCIVLAYGESDNYESIAFIDVDKEGNITKIYLSIDSGYRFKFDNPMDGFENTEEPSASATDK